jgi:hypothetical protein
LSRDVATFQPIPQVISNPSKTALVKYITAATKRRELVRTSVPVFHKGQWMIKVNRLKREVEKPQRSWYAAYIAIGLTVTVALTFTAGYFLQANVGPKRMAVALMCGAAGLVATWYVVINPALRAWVAIKALHDRMRGQ